MLKKSLQHFFNPSEQKKSHSKYLNNITAKKRNLKIFNFLERVKFERMSFGYGGDRYGGGDRNGINFKTRTSFFDNLSVSRTNSDGSYRAYL